MVKQKLTGFSLFLMEYNRRNGIEGSIWTNSDEGKLEWDILSESAKREYSERAKAKNTGSSYAPPPRTAGPISTVSRMSFESGKKTLKDYTQPEISSYISQCIDAQQAFYHSKMKNVNNIKNSDFMLISFSVLSNIVHHDPEYPNLEINIDKASVSVDYVSLSQVKVIPVEVTILEYSFLHGLKQAYHKIIQAGPIPIGFKYEAFKCINETHKIPLEGVPDSETIINVSKTLHAIGHYASEKQMPFYAMSCEIENVCQSLKYFDNMSGNKNLIFPILRFEDLAVALCNKCAFEEAKNTINSFDVRGILESVSNLYDDRLRCLYHSEIGCRFCSLVRCLILARFFSQHLTSLYNIANTKLHNPTSPSLKKCPFTI